MVPLLKNTISFIISIQIRHNDNNNNIDISMPHMYCMYITLYNNTVRYFLTIHVINYCMIDYFL